MRRHSPARMRHRSPPPRRRGGAARRSMSPLSRSQPAPPGEERDRKAAQWEAPNNRNSRFRSRSRSREWNGRSSNREAPVVDLDEPRRDRANRDRRDRGGRTVRDIELKEPPHRPSQGFEENYLEHQPLIFESNMQGPPRLDNIIQEAPPMMFDPFLQGKPVGGNERELHLEPPPRERRRNSPLRRSRSPNRRPSRFSARSPDRRAERRESPRGKAESERERLIRLEKLVEKLVEGKSQDRRERSPSPPKKRLTELIPSNTKFTTSMWLNSVHEECLRRNYDEKNSIRFMEDQMSGIVKAWFKTISHFNFTWPELKLLITKTFPDNIDFAQTLKLLVSRDKVPEETLTQYYFSKLYLCEACKITGENAVSCLIDGLNNPFMKQDIKAQNFLTPEALYSEYLSKCPENEPAIRMTRREVVMPEFQPPDNYLTVEMLQENIMGHQEQIYTHPEDGHSRKKCYTCNKVGHLAIDCRHAPICYKCKKKGHIAAKCSYKSSGVNVITSTTRYRVATKKCLVNGRRFTALLDTGSQVVTVQRKVVEQLGLGLKPSKEELHGFGMGKVRPLGQVTVDLVVDGVGRSVEALVVDNDVQGDEVIVGQEFLGLNGVVLVQYEGKVMLCTSKPI